MSTSFVNMGDVVATIFLLSFTVIIPAIIIFTLYKGSKQNKKRAAERLTQERENTMNLQKQLNELTDRVMVLEKIARGLK